MFNPLYPNNIKEIEFYKTYYNIKPENCINYLYADKIDQDVTDLYIITFNNLFCVEYQLKTIRSFMKQKYNIIIIDNNNDLNPDVSSKTLDICKKENITYIKAPNNLFQTPEMFDPSQKLGTTMNWIFHNCVKSRQPKYFGYLDQDCFLFNDCDLRDYLDTKYMYGQVSIGTFSKVAWNLHVTSNFYKYDFVKDLPLDFRASHKYQLDTGGANYDILYKDFNHKDYEFDACGFKYFDHDIGDAKTFQYYAICDHKWIHMCGSTGGNTAGQVDTKVAYIKGFLDCVLNKNSKFF